MSIYQDGNVELNLENVIQEDPPQDKKPKVDDNPMKKILAVVGLAIVIFLASISFSLQNSLKNNEQLLEIRDLYFPILERVDANIVRIDKIEERFLQAVMTGDLDEVDNAQDFFEESDEVFIEMISLYPSRELEIQNIREEFVVYIELAIATSDAFINETDVDVFELSTSMNEALSGLRESVRLFREQSYQNFVSTLEESQAVATLSMYMSIAVGLMNLMFMGVLVFFIRNNVKMVAVIAEQNANLEMRVSERTAELAKKTNDINAMLDHMNLGVCTVVPGNLIHHEFSSFLKTIFDNEDLANANVIDALFENSNIGVDSRDQISVSLDSILGSESMIFDFNGHLLVTEMNLVREGEADKILQLEWSPIVNAEDEVEKVLLIVQDVTEFRALESESAEQKEELDIISQLLKIPVAKFTDFASSAEEFIQKNKELIEGNDEIDLEVVAAMFRNMHTIKGNARTYEFGYITNAAHIAEQEYDRLRKNTDAEWDKEIMLEQLKDVEIGVVKYVDMSENKLRRKGRATDQLTSRGSFVSNDELRQIKESIRDLVRAGESPEAIKIERMISTIGMVDLERLVSGSMDFVSSLAEELGKPIPEYKITNGEVFFTSELGQAMKSSFMHIVRNSLDHGIEQPEERVSKGKPEAGSLMFDIVEEGENMELHIGDDGRGLALHKLYEKAVGAGVMEKEDKPNAQTVAELMFNSGLSTAESVSEISGRGVGMDAVRHFMKEQKGDIRIELLDPQEELTFSAFKFVLSLPQGAYQSRS